MVDVRSTAQTIIGVLYSDGNGKAAQLAALRSTRVITDRYSQKIWPLLASNCENPLVLANGQLSYEGLALYNTLRLYAIYQQGKTTGNGRLIPVAGSKKDDAKELMEVLSQLRGDDKIRNGVDRQVNRILAAPNLTFMMNALVRAIKILKAQDRNVKINFAQLAQELYQFQFGIDAANTLRFKWGSQYYRETNENSQNEGKD